MRYSAFLIALVIAVAALAAACFAQTQTNLQANTVDLFSGIRSGVLQAEFRGAGDNFVTGTVRSTNPQLTQMYVPPGTQFQGQVPGRQGMNTLQPQRLGLNPGGETKVTILTACTDIGLPAPTASDVLIPMPCPDERIARLAAVVEAHSPSPEVAQIAVWAIANNPPSAALRVFMDRVAPGAPPVAEPTRRGLMNAAATLLRDAGLEPASFAMFQPGPQAQPKPNVRQRMENRRTPGMTR